MNVSSAAPRLQSKLLGAVSVGLAVVLLCALAGLATAWLKLSTEVPPEVALSRDAERLQREFRSQVQEWKNVLLRGHDDALRQRHLEAFDNEGRVVAELAQRVGRGQDLPHADGRRHRTALPHRHAGLGVETAFVPADGEEGAGIDVGILGRIDGMRDVCWRRLGRSRR